MKKHQMCYHLYADDTQLYLSFDSTVPGSGTNAISRLEACISDIREWMLRNRLKINDDTTEFLKFLPLSNTHEVTPNSLLNGSDSIALSTKAKNLGVLFDQTLNLSSHITATCKSANFQLYSIRRIKCYLSLNPLKTAVHALISSKLDQCNNLLIGLPKNELFKLEHIMNIAARMITGTKKFIHIAPMLVDLHWLPVDYCVKFNLLCLTYKALHSLAPAYLTNILQQYSPIRSLCSVEQELLCIPKVCTN